MTHPGTPQGSFGGAAGRGLALIIFAIVIGFALLNSTVDRGGAVDVVSEGSTTTTAPLSDGDDSTTTTTAAENTGDTTEGVITPTTEDTALPTTALVPANELQVVVVNAKTGVNGAAGRLTTLIGGLGYVTVEPSNGTGEALEDSIIYFELGSRGEANKLANDLGWNLDFVQERPAVVPASDFSEDPTEWPDLIVMLGKNQAVAG